METIDLDGWVGFQFALTKIQAELGSRMSALPDQEQIGLRNDILFRGQTNAAWKLQTTLERTTAVDYTPQDYLKRAGSVVNEIESVTGKKWGVKSNPDIEQDIADISDSVTNHLPHYDYLVYLRHHGFPSPLLDWTTSPYIAAFFAMEQPCDAERCAIFAFVETPDGGKAVRGGDVIITSKGPYVTTDARHFAQKSRYTYATQWDEDSNTNVFRPHESVTPSSIQYQDVLIKITIPRIDRIVALQQLEEYNINHYTLYGSEDALIRALGLRAFELDKA